MAKPATQVSQRDESKLPESAKAAPPKVELKKIQVTADYLQVPKGVVLGLGTKLADEHVAAGTIERVSPHHYKTIAETVEFGKNSVLWIDQSYIPKSGVRQVPMPRRYMEESPMSIKKRDDYLNRHHEEQEAHLNKKAK